ncbi:hypothetical protein C7C56_009255 [Massilia glaciei]|uniref:Uncharacterized protein n=2 Tax=Massilia glaciei TaxID=1524097 RepID=A0A2U2HN52_9BURK|nr:hypothetical protein C7C56_009255 [Massilia glaciei]
MYWGVRDKRSIAQYRDNLLGVSRAIPAMLRLFGANGIHATWATVGFIFFKDADELRQHLPASLPTYGSANLSPYDYMADAPGLEADYHFAPALIEQIAATEGQEIATHTFSHYYCLEDGQTLAQFKDDIGAAIGVAARKGFSVKSLVFPRNQWNGQYLSALAELGVRCYRGNESNWMYKASNGDGQSRLQRAARLVDTYFNLSGHNTHALADCTREAPYNFAASRFLRPYSEKLGVLEGLRLRRIKNAMRDAAVNKRIFHLWWHPHNFGVNLQSNMAFLERVIAYQAVLRREHGMLSLNMGELCQLAGGADGQ